MKAMVMAAGLGTRLGELTADRPKILMDINGKSVLELILESLSAAGIDDVIINLHHHADMIEKVAGEIGARLKIKIAFSDERNLLLDTGGGLYNARHFFDNEHFLLYNGDILTDLDLAKLLAFNHRTGAAATIATRQREGSRFFLVDRNNRVRGWTNTRTNIDIVTIDEPMDLSPIASMAVNVLSPKIFSYMEEGVYSLTSIILKMAVSELVNTFRYDRGYWIDIGTPEKLKEARSNENI